MAYRWTFKKDPLKLEDFASDPQLNMIYNRPWFVKHVFEFYFRYGSNRA